MKKIFKILIELILGFVAFLLLGTMYFFNAVLILCIVAFIWVLETKRLNQKNKIIASLGILATALIYLIIPKNITGCGVLSTGRVCSTNTCQGLPMVALTSPQCIGKEVER